MKDQRSFGSRVLDGLGLLNSASLLLLSAGAAILLYFVGFSFLALFVWAYLLLLGAVQVILAALSHSRQRRVEREGQHRYGWVARTLHALAMVAWGVGVFMALVLPLLPTKANKIRDRDSHYLVQNFKEHRQEIESLRAELLHPQKGIFWQKRCGFAFGWDGMSEVYKDGRVDIELFQEPQGFNGQVFVGYAKIGKMALDGTDGPVVDDIREYRGHSYMTYQALGDGWYIYFWSS